ncbi:MAG: hypothetical protein KJ811_03280 [Candidatus Margulisbacteria bacterium]|nr:hypothetical protein [Candidatus Margulisiibacteriota bacterium]
MNKCLSIILILFVATFASAQNKDFTINGDNVSYDKEQQLIHAEGNVAVEYKDILVFGRDITYNAKTDMVHARDGFTLNYENISFEGESLDYKLKLRQGSASEVSFAYQGLQLAGKKIDLEKDVFILKNASFTTCDEPNPHYHVSAADLTVYPEYGWLVAYWAYFWLDRLPVLPMPTYIYDIYAEERERSNIPPFPDIGSNDEDGSYVHERFAWHIKRELSGTYSLTYAAKKGLGGGIEADYILSNDSRGNVRFYTAGSDGLSAGLTHSLFFGEDVNARDREVPFFSKPKRRRYELETMFSFRERINYERVSFLPGFVLRSRENDLAQSLVKYDYEIGTARIFEENTLDLERNLAKARVYKDFTDLPVGTISPAVELDSRFYSSGGRWLKATGGLKIRKSLARNTQLGLGYFHYFKVSGASPFNFENYRFSPLDRFTSELIFMLGKFGLGYETSYFIDNWQPEDLDYSIFFDMHCYNVKFKYRSLRQEFELGFGLNT